MKLSYTNVLFKANEWINFLIIFALLRNCLSCGDVLLQSTIKDVKDYDYDEFVGASCAA